MLSWLSPGVPSFHGTVYTATTACVVAITLAGAWLPARRALSVDPTLVLARDEEW